MHVVVYPAPHPTLLLIPGELPTVIKSASLIDATTRRDAPVHFFYPNEHVVVDDDIIAGFEETLKPLRTILATSSPGFSLSGQYVLIRFHLTFKNTWLPAALPSNVVTIRNSRVMRPMPGCLMSLARHAWGTRVEVPHGMTNVPEGLLRHIEEASGQRECEFVVHGHIGPKLKFIEGTL